jgi:WD40 repeat protein
VPRSEVAAIAFSPDGRLLVTGQADRGIHVWSLSSRKQVARLAPQVAADAIRFSADGRRILLGNVRGSWELTLPR